MTPAAVQTPPEPAVPMAQREDSKRKSFHEELLASPALLINTLSLAGAGSLSEIRHSLTSPRPISSPQPPRLNSQRSLTLLSKPGSPRRTSSTGQALPKQPSSAAGEEEEPFESAVELQELTDLDAPQQLAQHRWLSIDAAQWLLRSGTYLQNKRKAPSTTGSQMLAVELFRSTTVVTNAAGRKGAPTSALRLRCAESLDTLFVVNLMLPHKSGSMHVVMYFGVHAPPPGAPAPAAVALLRRFREESDAWRNARFKMIAKIATGPFLVKMAVPAQPAITGKTVPQQFHVAADYVEVDMDITRSAAAGRVLGVVRPHAKSLAVDVCFLLEGQTAEELPEMAIGCGRLSFLDLADTAVPLLDASAP